jgi:glycosyltransferase involved in cell wall biosynthesis
MRILLWHVHGSWTTAFVQGDHEYVLPVTADRGPDGLGRARTWDWPASVRELSPEQLADHPIDAVILQRPHESALVSRWLGRRPGVDLPAAYLEHNTPSGHTPDVRHPLADQCEIPIVHVTHFNDVFWDNGRADHVVIEHGVVDPGARYSGDTPRLAVVGNDPLSRYRTLGTDLLPAFAGHGIDLFGMRVTGVRNHLQRQENRRIDVNEYEDLPQHELHPMLARRRAYLHLTRWTSLGLSLIEAMTIGMPVLVLASTEASDAVPPEAGAISTNISRLQGAARLFLHDRDAARAAGVVARRAALERYGLRRFLADWDELLKEVVR